MRFAMLFVLGSILQEAERAESWPARVYVGIGTRETKDAQLNSASAALRGRLESCVRKASPDSTVKILVEENGTHQSASWRRRLPVALAFLFPREREAHA